MTPRKVLDGWTLSAAYFVVIALLFASAAVISMQPHDVIGARLVARHADTIGVTDVLSSVHSGNLGRAGVATLMLIGPAAEMFRTSFVLWMTAGFLFLTAAALFRRFRIAAFAGAAWAILVVALSGIVVMQVSVSYSIPARLFMFGPAAAFNVVVLIALWRSVRPLSAPRTI